MILRSSALKKGAYRAQYMCMALVFSLSLAVGILPATAAAFAGGDGSENAPYQVATCQQLQDISNGLEAYYELKNDIDCSATIGWNDGDGFVPIGDNGDPFVGILDGKGYAVSDLFMDTTNNGNVPGGLFGQIGDPVDQEGLVKDFGLEDVDILGGWSTGGLVGVLYGQVNNTYTTGFVEGTGEVGGLVGSHGGIYDTVIDSSSSAEVYGDQVVGGLVGYNAHDTNIINSYATGDVWGEGNNVGGLVGFNSGNIENAHATGNVHSESNLVGGLVGRNDGEITKTYAAGNVQAEEDYAGGLVAQNVGLIEISYSDNEEGDDAGVSAYCNAAGLVALNSDEGVIRNAFSHSSSTNVECATAGLVSVNWGSVSNTYATGVSGDSIGLVGYAMGGSEQWTSFWDTQTTGSNIACDYEDDGAECDGALRFVGRTTSQMKTQTTFTDDLSEGAWNFETIWSINPEVNQGYPFFQSVGATPADQPEQEEPVDEVEPIETEDVNGDGIPDNEQNLVAFISSFTNKLMVLELSDECDFEVGIKQETQFAAQDSGYDYPENFIRFAANCGTPGFTTTVKQYYYDRDPAGLVARKHNPATNAYFNIPGATVEKLTINGKTVSKVTFTVTDGGLLDVDGQRNGLIEDPAGLAQSMVGTPNTGFGIVDSNFRKK